MSIPNNMSILLYNSFEAIYEWCFENDFEIDSRNGYLSLTNKDMSLETLVWVFGKHLQYDKLKLSIENTIHKLNLFRYKIDYCHRDTSMFYTPFNTEIRFVENDLFCNKCTKRIVFYQPFTNKIHTTCDHIISLESLYELIY